MLNKMIGEAVNVAEQAEVITRQHPILTDEHDQDMNDFMK